MLWVMLLCVMTVVGLHAQTPTVSIDVHDVTVKELLKRLESQSKYTFAYATSQLPLDKKVSVTATDTPVADVLAEVIPGIVAKVRDNKILLTVPQKKSAKSGESKKSVIGTVTDENGEPVIGATVMLKNSNNGVVTNIDGQFTINVTGDKPVLKVSYIGYTPKEVKVTPGVPANIVLKGSGVNLDEV